MGKMQIILASQWMKCDECGDNMAVDEPYVRIIHPRYFVNLCFKCIKEFPIVVEDWELERKHDV